MLNVKLNRNKVIAKFKAKLKELETENVQLSKKVKTHQKDVEDYNAKCMALVKKALSSKPDDPSVRIEFRPDYCESVNSREMKLDIRFSKNTWSVPEHPGNPGTAIMMNERQIKNLRSAINTLELCEEETVSSKVIDGFEGLINLCA